MSSKGYAESEAVNPEDEAAPIRRSDLEAAVTGLTCDLPVKAIMKDGVWHIVRAGRKVKASCNVARLESDPKITPLVPDQEFVREIATQLSEPGKLLPLVVGSCAEGPFRVSVAYWVGEGKLVKVETLVDLRRKMDRWTGEKSAPEIVLSAKQKAEREAKKSVAAMVARSAELQRAGLDA